MLEQLKKFIIRSNNLFLIAAGTSAVLIIVQYAPAVYKVLSDFDASKNVVQDSTTGYIGRLLESLSHVAFAGSLITAIAWGLVGLALYTVFFLLANIFIDARNEIYVAAEYSTDGVGSSEVLRHAGSKLLLAAAYMIFIGVSLLFLIKMWMNMAYIFIYSGLQLSNLPYLLGGYIGLTLNIYVAITLAYLIWKNNETAVLYN